MTLRDILERAHCCDELLAFASQRLALPPMEADEWGTYCQRCNCGPPPGMPFDPHDCIQKNDVDGGPRFLAFGQLWSGIERHDWLTWLMRHCPDQFEDSWRDCVSALHSLADFSTDLRSGWVRGSSMVPCPEPEARQREACRLIRLYVRLRK